jgi:hypothetical protein
MSLILRKEPDHPYLKSFLMPGYLKTYYEGDKVPDHIKLWNYSNYIILFGSLISAIAYVESDYEDDVYYRLATGGLALSSGFGIWGMSHAYLYNKDREENKRHSLRLGLDRGQPFLTYTIDF